MAMPAALENPNAQGPQSLASPVPGQADGGVAPAAIPTPDAQPIQRMSLPGMTIQAGDESRTPAGADLGEFGSLPTAGGQQGQPQQPASDLGEFDSLPSAGKPQSVGGATGAYGVVQLPDGKYGVQESNGTVRNLTDHEKQAAHYAAMALRMGGPTIGGLFGGAGGAAVPLPGAAAVGAGTGAIVGGDAVHPMAQFFEKLAGEQPRERGIVDRTLEGVLPGAAGAIESSLAKSGIQNVAEAGLSQELNQGAQIAGEESAKRIATAEAAGGKLFKHEVNPENAKVVEGAKDLKAGNLSQKASDEFKAAEVKRGNDNIRSLDNILEGVGPKQTEEMAKSSSVKQMFDGVTKTFEKRINVNKTEAQKIAGDRTFNVSDILSEHPEVKSRLKGEVTLADLDKEVSRTQEEASFGNFNRTPDQRRYGQLSRDLRVARDEFAAQVLDEAGKGKLAKQLRSDRDYYSTNIEDFKDLQAKLENDPTYVSKAIIEKENPRLVEKVVQILPDSKKSEIAREFVDQVGQKYVDREGKQISAIDFDKELNSYDPKILDALLGKQRTELQKFLNYAKIVDKYGIDGNGAAKSAVEKMSDMAVSAAKHPKYSMYKMMSSAVKQIFGKNPNVEEYILRGHSVEPLGVRAQKLASEAPATKAAPTTAERMKNAASGGAVGGAAAGTLGELYRKSKEK